MAERTIYIVLAQSGEPLAGKPQWFVHGRATSHSPAAAIRALLTDAEAEAGEGVFVAVPERSWKPTRVTAEVQTVLRFEDA